MWKHIKSQHIPLTITAVNLAVAYSMLPNIKNISVEAFGVIHLLIGVFGIFVASSNIRSRLAEENIDFKIEKAVAKMKVSMVANDAELFKSMNYGNNETNRIILGFVEGVAADLAELRDELGYKGDV